MTLEKYKDEEMQRIFNRIYPKNLIFPFALKIHKKQSITIHLKTAVVCSDKWGNEKHNVRFNAVIHKLNTKYGIIENGDYVMVFPRISFYVMFSNAGIPLDCNERSYKILFVKRNKQDYEILSSSVL